MTNPSVRPKSRRNNASSTKASRRSRTRRPSNAPNDLAKRDERKEEQRKWIAEIQNSFDFQLKGEETVDGVETYVIEAEPQD